MISRFFIDRPIFATVLSIVITLAGGIALFALPIALYPPISPPVVQVDCTYPGASAKDVSQTVATPIEQQVNGVDDMLYMSSQCTNDGAYNLTVTFKHGMNLNMAQVLVQNRVSLAVPLLPDVIKQTGVNVKKKAPDILMSIALNSPENKYDQLFISNYALLQVKDELARLPGVSDVTMLGQRDYSMRVWLDPDKLAARNMQAGDVVRSLREQNLHVAAGQIGQQPVPNGQNRQIPLSTLGRLTDVEQFERIVVKTGTEGRLVRLKDVARIELGAKNQDIECIVNGKPSVSMAIFQLPDANALDTADIVRAKMNELAVDFPPGLIYETRYDTTPFIRESIEEVFKTLREAIILVAIVVLLFLQNWRSAIIPLIAVPVAIIGTFAVMAMLGFSLNNLTLFGLVLAIGIVVDDAIVVVEAVEHHIEHGLAPREATVRAMEEVSGPVIAIGLVLTAVFVPCAFISGIVGQFFRQFALTIAVSTIISAFNSLTLSPALTALLLRPHDHSNKRKQALPRIAYIALGGVLAYFMLGEPLTERLLHLVPGLAARVGEKAPLIASCLIGLAGAVVGWLVATPVDFLLSTFFRIFNAAFRMGTSVYGMIIGGLLRVSILVLVGYVGLLYVTYDQFSKTPTGFIPSQDMGYLMINLQMPDAAAAERTRVVMKQMELIARGKPGDPAYPGTPGIKHSQTMAGQSMLLSANGSNFGSMFVMLDSFANRREPVKIKNPDGTERLMSLSSDSIRTELDKKFKAAFPDAIITVLGPPPVRGVGRAGGFKIMVEDIGDVTPQELQRETEAYVAKAKEEVQPLKEGQTTALPSLVGLTSVFRANVPSLYVDVDRTQALVRKVSTRDLFDTLRIYLGSVYVNDINLFGRTWQVVVQAEPNYRNHVDDARHLKVRNADGAMVPLGTVANVNVVNGPLVLTRYNQHPAAPVNGSAAPGISSGEAIKLMEQVAKNNLSSNMAVEWTELAFLELQAGNTAMVIFAISVLMVFLVLAAQYESWSLPLAIILVVPMCLLSAVYGVGLAGQDINIFTQIGFVVLVGLASKNAILIVEFAKARREEGESARQATLDACKLRLRPIIMTSLAFILGVVPLIVSYGAGAEMRRTLGTTVFSGMVGVTIFGIFLTPVFFYVIENLGESKIFHTRFMIKFNEIVLGAISLRPARALVKQMLTRPRVTPPPPHKPEPIPELQPAEEEQLVEQK